MFYNGFAGFVTILDMSEIFSSHLKWSETNFVCFCMVLTCLDSTMKEIMQL